MLTSQQNLNDMCCLLHTPLKNLICHDTVIPRLIYPAPLEPGSQAAVGLTSTAMGDLAGISGAVPFYIHLLFWCPLSRQAMRLTAHSKLAALRL